MSLMAYLNAARTVEHGDGYRIVELPNHAEPVLMLDHAWLTLESQSALQFAASHGGDLPNTPYWDRIENAYRADPVLFQATHECPTLLALVHRDAWHDAHAAGSRQPPPSGSRVQATVAVIPPPPLA